MSSKMPRATEDDTELKDDGQDTEGHSLMIDPTTARQLARVKEQDVDRASRDRQRQKDARGK
jgi:hypothetical protein